MLVNGYSTSRNRRGDGGVIETAQRGALQRALPVEKADELLGIHRSRQRPQTRAGPPDKLSGTIWWPSKSRPFPVSVTALRDEKTAACSHRHPASPLIDKQRRPASPFAYELELGADPILSRPRRVGARCKGLQLIHYRRGGLCERRDWDRTGPHSE